MRLLIGGSPCTHWSIARTKDRETKPEGRGWKLFLNYIIALEKYRPRYFLYENNKSMSAEIRKQITKELGVEPIEINSALVSAQRRKRLYWTNIPGIGQPEDKGILLRDILETGVVWREKAYTLKANYTKAGAVNGVSGQHFPAPMAAEPVRIGTIESDAKNADFDSRPSWRLIFERGKNMDEMRVWHNTPPESRKAAQELLSIPLEEKIAYTCANISEWDAFTGGKWYISFSGGKDSTVLLYIAAAMLNRMSVQPHPLRVVFFDTGLEYPEIRKFVPKYLDWIEGKFKRIKIEYTRRRPQKSFLTVIREYGYPLISKEIAQIICGAKSGTPVFVAKINGEYKEKYGKEDFIDASKYKFILDAPFNISDKCCKKMKKEPSDLYCKQTGCSFISAVMATEGRRRMSSWLRGGCNSYESKRKQSKPMSFWTEQDVLHFIVNNKIPICSVYGDIMYFDGQNFYYKSIIDGSLKCTGCQRTGCIFCAFGAHLEKGETRFQRLRRTHPKHWNYAINGGEWDPADGMWKPSKTPGHIGLGMSRVLDFIGVPYD